MADTEPPDAPTRRLASRENKIALVSADSANVDETKPSKPSRSDSALRHHVELLRMRLSLVRRNLSLLLVYATIFLDFMGTTLLSPGMRFLVDPSHDDAFEDFRPPRGCAHAEEASSGDFSHCQPPSRMAPGTAVSIMMFTFGLGQLISTPLMGWASDRLGKTRVLKISTLGTAVTFVLQGLAWSFWPHNAMRFLGGLFSGTRPGAPRLT
jgi:MFS family permease